MARYCSIPGIPYVRDWVEKNFGDICQGHDEAYAEDKCRVCRDIKFIGLAAGRCLPFVLALVLLPLIFIGFQINTIWGKIFGGVNG